MIINFSPSLQYVAVIFLSITLYVFMYTCMYRYVQVYYSTYVYFSVSMVLGHDEKIYKYFYYLIPCTCSYCTTSLHWFNYIYSAFVSITLPLIPICVRIMFLFWMPWKVVFGLKVFPSWNKINWTWSWYTQTQHTHTHTPWLSSNMLAGFTSLKSGWVVQQARINWDWHNTHNFSVTVCTTFTNTRIQLHMREKELRHV